MSDEQLKPLKKFNVIRTETRVMTIMAESEEDAMDKAMDENFADATLFSSPEYTADIVN